MSASGVNSPTKFYPIVEALEAALGYTVSPLDLISLVSRKQYILIRKDIVNVFNIGEVAKFSGRFGTEVEFGDISDAIRGVTFSLYDQSTEMDKLIGLDERNVWCSKILAAMDAAARTDG